MKEVAVTIVKQDHCGMLTGEYNMDFIETEEDYIIINGISFNIIEIPVGKYTSKEYFYRDGKLGDDDFILSIMIMRVK